MRRLARHALNALTALSLLLCVATVALGGRSLFVTEQYGYARVSVQNGYILKARGGVFSQSGRLCVGRATLKAPVDNYLSFHHTMPVVEHRFGWLTDDCGW